MLVIAVYIVMAIVAMPTSCITMRSNLRPAFTYTQITEASLASGSPSLVITNVMTHWLGITVRLLMYFAVAVWPVLFGNHRVVYM